MFLEVTVMFMVWFHFLELPIYKYRVSILCSFYEWNGFLSTLLHTIGIQASTVEWYCREKNIFRRRNCALNVISLELVHWTSDISATSPWNQSQKQENSCCHIITGRTLWTGAWGLPTSFEKSVWEHLKGLLRERLLSE